MPEPKDAPVILELYDLMVWTLNHAARFPRLSVLRASA